VRFFLKLKAWHLFAAFIIPGVVGSWSVFDVQAPEEFESSFRNVMLVNIFFGVVFVGWVYSIGISANRRLSSELKLSELPLKLGLGYALVYMFIFTMFVSGIGSPSSSGTFALIMPFHLLAMFGMFFGLWYSAKQLVTLREGKEVSFTDFSGPFFLIWFFPIGVWFVQPMVNELLGEAHET